ncbi:MAG: F0F1 ATP synthase subunit delta [Patescibacteria group bacterium]
MSLAQSYADALKELEAAQIADVAEKMIIRMKAKGHLSILPDVVRILERDAAKPDAIVAVASESDLKRHAKAIAAALAAVSADPKSVATIIEPNIVGGFSVRRGSKLVDATDRRALVSIYQNVIS